MAAYRGLVYDDAGFVDYFFAATPIAEIAELNIGSRPASRKPTRGSRICAPFPGASPGARPRWRCRAGIGFGSAIEVFVARTGAEAAHRSCFGA